MPAGLGHHHARCIGVQLFGHNIDVDEHGENITGDTMLLLFNADHALTINFKLPPPGEENPWELVFDTSRDGNGEGEMPKESYELQPVSMAVLRARSAKREETI